VYLFGLSLAHVTEKWVYFVPKVLTVHTNLHIKVYRNIFACEELQPFQLSSRYNMPVCVCVCCQVETIQTTSSQMLSPAVQQGDGKYFINGMGKTHSCAS